MSLLGYLPTTFRYQWTEWFSSWMADPEKMQARDYNIPLQVCELVDIRVWCSGLCYACPLVRIRIT